MLRTALIVVDVQSDFLPGGALGIETSDEIIGPIVELAPHCGLVVASRDWHPADHTSFKNAQYFGGEPPDRWPTHCVQGTKGARIHSKIRKLAKYTVSKGVDRDAEAFSAFQGATLRPVLSLEEIIFRFDPERVIVAGLALDYCVRWTALDANGLGFDTYVPLDCTRAIQPGTGRQALDAFERAGVKHRDTWRETL